jgi:hypothetical protein
MELPRDSLAYFGPRRKSFVGIVVGSVKQPLTEAVTEAPENWGVSYVIQWNLYDSDPASDFGLFDVNGNATELEAYYHGMYTSDNQGVREPGRSQPPARRPYRNWK